MLELKQSLFLAACSFKQAARRRRLASTTFVVKLAKNPYFEALVDQINACEDYEIAFF